MTNRSRNLFVLVLFVGLLAAAAVVIARRPTLLGLDLQGGVQLTYQAEPTPQVPKVTSAAINNALSVIRKRTDALGVSEPEIQQSGNNEITVGLPAVKNVNQAIKQVGSTSQLEFYNWEAVLRNAGNPFSSEYAAIKYAQTQKPVVSRSDLPASGIPASIRARFHDNTKELEAYYDRRNDTSTATYYLFNAQHGIVFSDNSCQALANDIRANGSTTGKKFSGLCGSVLPPEPQGYQVLEVPQGISLVAEPRPTGLAKNIQFHQYYVIEDDAVLSGTQVTNPKVETDPTSGQIVVAMDFTSTGQKDFAAMTKTLAQAGLQQALSDPSASPLDNFHHFAIVLNGSLVSLASIDYRQYPDGISGKTGAEISDIGTYKQASYIQQQLSIGSLPIKLKLISQDQVSATLGQQALHQGLVAGLIGLGLTILFLLIFYQLLGIVAGIGLIAYGLLFFALIKIIPITMTLPGIAGLILTVGVAADANIVIFERVKEEARSGASIPKAIANGYRKALRAIIDANAVTFGVAFILFMLAVASVQGFAFTLGVGTLVSLFTAVVATSAMLSLLGTRRFFSDHAGLRRQSHRGWRFDFMGQSRWFFALSGCILTVGAVAIAGIGLHFGIDFESGTRITTPLNTQVNAQEVRSNLSRIGYGTAQVQTLRDPQLGSNVFQISLAQLQPNQLNQVEQTLVPLGLKTQQANVDSIGPTFGKQVEHSAIVAIIASLLLISLYIAFRFSGKYTVPVMIALAHDLLITAGVYALTGRPVTTDTVAALLTILGYSLYDTIIVFDRIRENEPRMRRATFSQIANRSMSEVLTRSLATSFSTLLPITALLIFGGSTLQDFAFALLVGVASGAYSSIFIATPVLTHWKERETGYRRRRQTMLAQLGEVPAYETEAVRNLSGKRPATIAATRPQKHQPAPVAPTQPIPPATAQSPSRRMVSVERTIDPQITDTDHVDASPALEKSAPSPPKNAVSRKKRKHGRR
jgi:SecD/SecF fusion protein